MNNGNVSFRPIAPPKNLFVAVARPECRGINGSQICNVFVTSGVHLIDTQ